MTVLHTTSQIQKPQIQHQVWCQTYQQHSQEQSLYHYSQHVCLLQTPKASVQCWYFPSVMPASHIECKTLCAPLQLTQDEWFQSSSKTKDNQIGSSDTKEQQKPVTTLWANTTSYPLLKLSSTSTKQPSQNWKLFALLNWLTFTLMMAIFRESGGDGHQWMYLKCSVATLVACFCLSTCF